MAPPCSTIIKNVKKVTAEYQNKHRALLNTVPWPITWAALELALDPGLAIDGSSWGDPHRFWLKYFLSLHMALQPLLFPQQP